MNIDTNVDPIFQKLKNDQERAVLFACQEILRETNQKQSPVAYYGVLYRTVQQYLDAIKKQFPITLKDEDKGDELVERTRASVRLLDMACQKLPEGVVPKILDNTGTLCLAIFAKKPPPQVARPVLGVVRSVLCVPHTVDSEIGIGSKLFQLLIEQAVEGKPRVRKRAVNVIAQVLEVKDGRMGVLSSLIEKICGATIRQCKPDSSATVTLHTLTLLQQIMSKLPVPTCKKLCEVTLRLPGLGQSLITVCSMNLFSAVFAAFSNSSELIAALINALFNIQPNTIESDPFIAYTKAITKGFTVLSPLDANLAATKLPALVAHVLPAFQNEFPRVAKTIASSLKDAFAACITPALVQEAFTWVHEPHKPQNNDNSSDNSSNSSKNKKNKEQKPVIIKITRKLKKGLKYAYQNSWTQVLETITHFIKTLHERRPVLSDVETTQKSFLLLLKDLVLDAAYLQGGRWGQFVEKVLDAALETLGIKCFLELLPLKFPTIDYTSASKPDDDHLWLLPFLKKHIHHSLLGYYASYFIPIAEKLQENSQKAKDDGKPVESLHLATISFQIWELFPGFCNFPRDVGQSFKNIAKGILNSFIERPNLRVILGSGMQSLILKNKALIESIKPDASPSQEQEQAKADISTVAFFAKNFLPGLFNIIVTTPNLTSADYSAIYMTASALVAISDSALANTMFTTVAGKLVKETSTEIPQDPQQRTVHNQTISALTDITVMFVKKIEMKNVEFLFRTVRPNFSSQDFSIQKKSLKVLTEICTNHRSLVRANINDLVSILKESAPKDNNNATKKLRMKLTKLIFEESPSLSIEMLQTLLPEVIQNTKETNNKARDAAHDVFTFLGEKCKSLPGDNLQTLCNIISAGLALDPHFISATFYSLSLLIHPHYQLLNNNYQSELLKTTLACLALKQREVVHSAVDFVQVLYTCFPAEIVVPSIPEFVKGVAGWSPEFSTRFRSRVKIILEKLVRKFGYEAVGPHVPWTTLMSNIRKAIAREKKKKDEKKNKKKNNNNDGNNNNNDDDNNEMEDEESEEILDEIESRPSKKRFEGTWVSGGKSDEDIIDFLESSAAKHVISTDPTRLNRKRKLEEEFQKSDDGKFLVEDLPELENLKKSHRKRLKTGYDLKSVTKEGEEDGEDNDNDKDNKNINNSDKKKMVREMMAKGGKLSMAARLKLAREQQAKTSSFSPSKYKSAIAAGDVKKKDNKYEPFAYVPLDPRQLNKRRRLHAHKKYKVVMTRKRSSVGIVKLGGNNSGVGKARSSLRGVTKPRTQRKAEKKHKQAQNQQ